MLAAGVSVGVVVAVLFLLLDSGAVVMALVLSWRYCN